MQQAYIVEGIMRLRKRAHRLVRVRKILGTDEGGGEECKEVVESDDI